MSDEAVSDEGLSDEAVAEPAEPVTSGADIGRPVARRLLVLALALLASVVLLEMAAGPVLRRTRDPHHGRAVLAIPGVAGMVRAAQADPAEVTQVAASQHQPLPLAVPALALVDGLLLVGAAAFALPRLVPGRQATRGGRLGLFGGSLVVLLVAVAVAVAAIARLRYLVALYLSPPFGTLSYLLLYGSFRRSAAIVVLSVLLVLKVGAGAALFCAYPRAAAQRGLAGLALTSVAATVVAASCYVWAPTTLASITDALAAAVVALVAVLGAGVVVSGSVRRLA